MNKARRMRDIFNAGYSHGRKSYRCEDDEAERQWKELRTPARYVYSEAFFAGRRRVKKRKRLTLV